MEYILKLIKTSGHDYYNDKLDDIDLSIITDVTKITYYQHL